MCALCIPVKLLPCFSKIVIKTPTLSFWKYKSIRWTSRRVLLQLRVSRTARRIFDFASEVAIARQKQRKNNEACSNWTFPRKYAYDNNRLAFFPMQNKWDYTQTDTQKGARLAMYMYYIPPICMNDPLPWSSRYSIQPVGRPAGLPCTLVPLVQYTIAAGTLELELGPKLLRVASRQFIHIYTIPRHF